METAGPARTGPPSLGPPNPSRRLVGVRIGVAGVVIAPEVDTAAAAALDDPGFVAGPLLKNC